MGRATMTYIVRAHTWGHGYVLDIEGVGATQTYDEYPEDTPEIMVRDYLVCTGLDDAMTADITIIYE